MAVYIVCLDTWEDESEIVNMYITDLTDEDIEISVKVSGGSSEGI